MKCNQLAAAIISVCLLFYSTGCTQKTDKQLEEQVQTSKEIQKEEPKESETPAPEVKKEVKIEPKEYKNDEVTDLYPELKEIEEYLFEQYADVLSKEAQETQVYNRPVYFRYEEGKEPHASMDVNINFKDSVTKRQMLDAVSYAIEKLKTVFPKETDTTIQAMAENTYTDEGALKKEYYNAPLGIAATLPYYSDEEEMEWRIKTQPEGRWKSFDFDEVEQYAKAPEPQTETKATSAFNIEQMKETLKGIGIEEYETGVNEDGERTSIAANADRTLGYAAVLEENGDIKKIMFMSVWTETITAEKYVEISNMYFLACALSPFDNSQEGRAGAGTFILDNFDALLKSPGEIEKAVIEGWNFSMGYENGIYLLSIIKA